MQTRSQLRYGPALQWGDYPQIRDHCNWTPQPAFFGRFALCPVRILVLASPIIAQGLRGSATRAPRQAPR